MKRDDMATVLEWEDDDVPAIIPKRLWDSLLDYHESLLNLANAACCVNQRMVAGARSGGVVDHAYLSELEEVTAGTLDDLAKEKEQLHRLRALLKWVPPADFQVKH
jgi:hypothetical protein